MLSYFDFPIDFQVLFQNTEVLVTYILKMVTEKYTSRSFALGSVTNKGICQTCSICPNQCLTLHCPALGGWVFQTAAPELLFPWGCGWLLAMGHSNRALKGTEETEVFFLSRLPHYSLHVLLFSQDLLLWVVSFHCHSIVVTASQILWLAKLNSFIIFFIIFS